jgi:nucleoside-diphosphate-sugar epimerase
VPQVPYPYHNGNLQILRALVNGGGSIGSHIVERLLNDGHDVRVLDNFAHGSAREPVAVRGRHRARRG